MGWFRKSKRKEKPVPDAFDEQPTNEKPAAAPAAAEPVPSASAPAPAPMKPDPCAKVDALAHEHEQAIDKLLADRDAKSAEIERLKVKFREQAEKDCECDDCSERAEAHFRRLTVKINRALAGGMD